jgi:hypothetical protein
LAQLGTPLSPEGKKTNEAEDQIAEQAGAVNCAVMWLLHADVYGAQCLTSNR